MKIVATFTGGIDSTVMIADYLKKGHTVTGLYFDYGQKIKNRELKAIKILSKFFKSKYKNRFKYNVISLNRLKKLGKRYKSGTIVGKKNHLPTASKNNLSNYKREIELAKFLWTPARNLYFLAEVLAEAEVQKANKIAFSLIYFSEEAKIDVTKSENFAFPDESPPWANAAKEIVKFSNLNNIKLESPFVDKKFTKEEVIKLGHKLNIPLEHTYNCLKGLNIPCGECQHCIRRKVLFEKLNIKDTRYRK